MESQQPCAQVPEVSLAMHALIHGEHVPSEEAQKDPAHNQKLCWHAGVVFLAIRPDNIMRMATVFVLASSGSQNPRL